MRTNSGFEQFHRNKPDFPRTKPNQRRYNGSAKPNKDTSPQPGENIVTNSEENKPNYSVIVLYAVAFGLGLVIGLLI